jgi:putative selenium metabolism protein SsnA
MLIHNARVVTWGSKSEILDDHAIVIENGIISELDKSHVLMDKYPAEERLDADNQLLMPGNLCAHTHFYGAFARGMAIPGRAPRDFPQILKKLWWPLDKALTEEDVRYSALVCLVDAIKHGTTTLIDHHASPNAIEGSLDIIAEAVEQAGLRAVLCYEVTDRDGPDRAKAGIEENRRFITRCQSEPVAGGRVQGTFGLHASLTLSDETLEACRRALPDGAGFHIHVAEHEADQYDSLTKSNMRVVDRLDQHNILGEQSIIAHAIHIDAHEVRLLADSQTWVTHQPRSNMNNGVGVAEVESMVRAGVRVCLGNDGFSNAMWEEWKTAYLLHKVWHRDPRRMPGDLIARMAVNHNAQLSQKFFPGAILGEICVGARADLILVDYHPTTPLNAGNLPWHILFGFHESMITTTIVDGQLLMQDRNLLTLDEQEITERSRELVPAVWERYQGYVPEDE